MKPFSVLMALILFIGAGIVTAETIVLQNGGEYSGCVDTYISDDDGQDGQNTNFGDVDMCSLQGYH